MVLLHNSRIFCLPYFINKSNRVTAQWNANLRFALLHCAYLFIDNNLYGSVNESTLLTSKVVRVYLYIYLYMWVYVCLCYLTRRWQCSNEEKNEMN